MAFNMFSANPHREANPMAIRPFPGGYIFGPAALNIIWGNDSRYWRIDSMWNNADLLQVSWLEVTGSIPLMPGKRYDIGFNVSLRPDAFGWSSCPIFLMAKIGRRGKYSWKKIDLSNLVDAAQFDIPGDHFLIDVVSYNPPDDNTLYFGLYEVWSGKWKGGLRIHYAFVREVGVVF